MTTVKTKVLRASIVVGILSSSFLSLAFDSTGGQSMEDKLNLKIKKNEQLHRLPDFRDRDVSVSNDRIVIKRVQRELNNNGFQLKVDGNIGQETRRALSRFQKEQGLVETGYINYDTLLALNVDSIDQYDRTPASVDEEDDTDVLSSGEMPNTSTESQSSSSGN
jgi:peptidoglycan hydrolase-like protein with peptidoglycan-binding domain